MIKSCKISASALAIAVMLGSAGAVRAEEVESEAPVSASSADQSTIIITGTRRTDRSVLESTAPIDVFTPEDLAAQGSGDMNNVLRSLIPSFNVAKFTAILSDGSSFVRPPTLRGLPSDQVLVLVNGKRRHRSALVAIAGGGGLTSGAQGVDLGQIPSIAIERMEVLRDGAAAQYGSDAIAGVMNYGLRTNSSGVELRGKYGQYYEGDGATYQLSGNAGLALGPSGFLSVSGEYLRSDDTSRGGQWPGAYAINEAMPEVGLPDPVQKNGDPNVRAGRIFVNGGIEVNDTDELYFFGNYGSSRQNTGFTWRHPYTVVATGKDGVTPETYTRTSVFNPIYLDQLPDGTWDVNGRTFSFTEFYPKGFSPTFGARIKDLSAFGGYRGEFDFGLTYDFSIGYGQSQIRYSLKNSVNASMGPDSPRDFYSGSLEERDTTFNADFSYPLEIGLASPLTIAFGGEHRIEAYEITPGDAASYAVGPYTVQHLSDGTTVTQAPSSSGFPGYSPSYAIDRSRRSYSAYIDLEGDIVAGLSAGVAGRYEYYTDFGDTVNVKGSARYELTDWLAFRGAASTGFRAPTVGQLYTTAGTLGFLGSQPIENLTLPAFTAAAQYFGAKELKPEKSVNLSAGAVATFDGGSITLDYYNIKVSDRIGMSGNFTVQTDEQREALRRGGLSNWATVGRIRYFTNAFDTRTQGVDLVFNYRQPTDIGTFASTLAVNYNATKVTDRNPSVIDDIRVGDIENLLPKWRATFTENWSSGRFQVIGRAHYFGKLTDYAEYANGGNKTFGSEFVFDLEVSYEATDFLTIAVGGENIFDQYPDRNKRAIGEPNQNWYETTGSLINGSRYLDTAPFGYNGGFWYIRAAARF